MEEEEHIPTLVKLIYAEQAALGAQGASERLLRWCAAFEAWLESYPPHRLARLTQPWRELLSSSQKMPWQITPGDVREYLAGLQARGFVNGTIHERRRHLERFYDWCQGQGVDELGFNPVKEVPKPKLIKYKKVHSLSASQAAALLAVLRVDGSVLGKRDYAFFLARLFLGVPLKFLLELRWGQINVAEDQAWVTWGGGESKRERLPGAVWAAIRDYLRASGRLEGIQPDHYIFAPLVNPINWKGGGTAGEWKPGAALRIITVRRYLKKFGRQAGIPEEKLKLTVLRHTAAMLRLETGVDIGGIQAFLGQSRKRDTLSYLNALAARREFSPDTTSKAVEPGASSMAKDSMA
ncbi:MAG: site-specific integrase, partial [Anaerolineales bacterium]|nr:site-specific integrase [Anaerolineales bacterium]